MSFWSPGATAGRAVWGRRGFKGAMRRVWRDLTETREVARTSVDPATGKVTARGVKRGPDGQRAGSKQKNAAKKAGSRQARRRTERASGRAARGTPARARSVKSSTLARDYQQGVGGRMNGSAPTAAGMPTPRQATGLTRLGCDWCRSSGMRPVYIGEGRIKTVIAVIPCNHRWSSKTNGPAQKPPAQTDSLLCQPCQNTGTVEIKTPGASGAIVATKAPCFTCQGWILHW